MQRRGVFGPQLTHVNVKTLSGDKDDFFDTRLTMFIEKATAAASAVLDKVCEELGAYPNTARAHATARILSAAGHECTIESGTRRARERSDNVAVIATCIITVAALTLYAGLIVVAVTRFRKLNDFIRELHKR